jgi:hypothetical protein
MDALSVSLKVPVAHAAQVGWSEAVPGVTTR